MKLLQLLSLVGLSSLTAGAQTLRIHTGQVTVAVPADRVGEASFTGDVLHVMDCHIPLSDIDSITVDRTPITDATVLVNYAESEARVTVSADIYPRLTLSTRGARVGITADPLLETEVTYRLTGSSSAGHFFMDGEWKSRIELVDLTLTAADSSAIEIANGKRIDIILPTGTTTTLADRAGGTHKACFFVNGHPELDGGGTLRLSGATKHAFASDEYTLLKAGFGTIDVTSAVSDGLHIQQYFRMDGGTVRLRGTRGDGIDVSATKDPADALNGQAIITGGSITMDVAAEDVKGIKTENLLTVSGGSITATVSGNGSKGMSAGTDLLVCDASGTAPAVTMTVTGTTYKPGDPDLESKCRGIKVKGNFTFDGGNIKISATGAKSKAISVDGGYIYQKGSIDCAVDSAY